MLDWLRRRFSRPAPHPNVRELYAVIACHISWRRACLEYAYRDGEDRATLEEEHRALTGYVEGVRLTDPLATLVANTPIGELDEGTLLEALYRAETAGALLWALGLSAVIPPIEQHADHELLMSMFPLDGQPGPSTMEARLRDRAEIDAALAEWQEQTAAARTRRDANHIEETAVQFSRAYERARGLRWVLGSADYIEDIA